MLIVISGFAFICTYFSYYFEFSLLLVFVFFSVRNACNNVLL